MQRVQLEGSPQAMGEAFGEAFRREIAELYGLRRANALEQARLHGGREASEDQLLFLAARSLEAARAFDPIGHEELVAIGRGADLTAPVVMALNGLTDLRDALAWGGPLESLGGCTAFIVHPDRSADGVLRIGQTWDLGTNNQPFVVAVHRRPDQGPETWSLTTVGCLSLMGLSETGVAIGTTNLRTRDARVGVPYLSLIHRALRCDDATEARRCIERAPRAGAHSYLLADARGEAGVLECTATLSRWRGAVRGFDVQTNHCQDPAHRALEGDTPLASSRARLARMQTLLGTGPPRTPSQLIEALGDRAGGSLSINRDDVDGISTNAAFLAAPALGEFLGCQGAPDRASWCRIGPGPCPQPPVRVAT